MRASSVNEAILDLLNAEPANHHLTSLEVYEHIRMRLPAVNPSTVYRALERLAHHGKISVSDMGTGSAVYEAVSNGMHHHLVCQSCGAVLTIEDEEIQGLFEKIQERYRFNICTNHLVLFGICPTCATNKEFKS